MKTSHLSIIAIIGFTTVLVGYLPQVHANCTIGETGGCPPPPYVSLPIRVNSDKSLYMENETLSIIGHVTDPETGKIVHIQIYNSTLALVKDYQTIESNNGTYGLQVKADLNNDGYYKIHAFVKSGQFGETDFFFIKKPYELVIGSKAYSINYTITQGKLEYISVNNKTNSIDAGVIDAPNGSTLGLPRKLVDAISADGNFIILMRGGSNDYHYARYSIINIPNGNIVEVHLSDGAGIPNPTGSWDVKIIGIKIIPEFALAIPVFLISFASIIIFYRMRLIK